MKIKYTTDDILEILILIESFQKRLSSTSLNKINILSYSDYVMSFEYFTDKYAPTHSHYELVDISLIENKFVITWEKVLDDVNAHYTPNNLSFLNKEEFINFITERYLNNSWSIRKVKIGRYNDMIDNIPNSIR